MVHLTGRSFPHKKRMGTRIRVSRSCFRTRMGLCKGAIRDERVYFSLVAPVPLQARTGKTSSSSKRNAPSSLAAFPSPLLIQIEIIGIPSPGPPTHNVLQVHPSSPSICTGVFVKPPSRPGPPDSTLRNAVSITPYQSQSTTPENREREKA